MMRKIGRCWLPWPSNWHQILLAASQVPETQTVLQNSDWQLVQKLQRLHHPVSHAPQVQDGCQTDSGATANELDALQKELARALEEADEACSNLRRTEAKVAGERKLHDVAPAVCKQPIQEEQCISVGALVEIQGAKAGCCCCCCPIHPQHR
eukprot:symbB.v1.2.029906.t2/scaffold3322.1/size91521/4